MVPLEILHGSIFGGLYLTYWTAVLIGAARPAGGALGRLAEVARRKRARLLTTRWPYTLIGPAANRGDIWTVRLVVGAALALRSTVAALLGVVFLSPPALLLGGAIVRAMVREEWRPAPRLAWGVIAIEGFMYCSAASLGAAIGWRWLVDGTPIGAVLIDSASAGLATLLIVAAGSAAVATIEAHGVVRLGIGTSLFERSRSG